MGVVKIHQNYWTTGFFKKNLSKASKLIKVNFGRGLIFRASWFSIPWAVDPAQDSLLYSWSALPQILAKSPSWNLPFIPRQKSPPPSSSPTIPSSKPTTLWSIPTLPSWLTMRLCMTFAGETWTLKDRHTPISIVWLDRLFLRLPVFLFIWKKTVHFSTFWLPTTLWACSYQRELSGLCLLIAFFVWTHIHDVQLSHKGLSERAREWNKQP